MTSGCVFSLFLLHEIERTPTAGLAFFVQCISKGETMEIFKDGVALEDNDFTLTDGQNSAVNAVASWYRSCKATVAKRFFVLAGAAGTGKSSIICHIRAKTGLSESQVLCCAYTGKAALNMLRKGNSSCTIHSSLYDTFLDKRTGEFHYVKKASLPYELVIVDEASMVSRKIFDDLLSFGKPVLFIGDHCQLPPIDEGLNLMASPDFTLTEIMRQSADSPIIRASQLAISGRSIPFCSFDRFRKIRRADVDDSDLMWADQIVVGTNAVRRALNECCREIMGFEKDELYEGERMICLQNNRKYGIFNGQILYMESKPVYGSGAYHGTFCDELAKEDTLLAIMDKPKSITFQLKEPPKRSVDRSSNAYLDYGYAISCHKAQGSGWGKVVVFDEGFGFDEETRRRWLYTAITRAKKEILIVS